MERRLHIRCGSDIREGLAAAGISGDFLEWSDPLCRGPVPEGVDRPNLRAMRADWIARTWALDRDETLKKLTDADTALQRLDTYDRVILWFEHDLYDQAVLLGLFDQIGPRENLHMISIDRHPGHPRFLGFGQLSPDELRALSGTEKPVSNDTVQTARAVYAAYRRGSPGEIEGIAKDARVAAALPFLPGALSRHLAELPGESDGLSLTERLTLTALARGAGTAGECFAALYKELDPQPFLGDLMYWEDVIRLASASLAAISPVPVSWTAPIELTPFGLDLTAGRAAWTERNSLDRWWGGRHLKIPAAERPVF